MTTTLVPIPPVSAPTLDVHPDLARAYRERGYAPVQIEYHLRWKAARERLTRPVMMIETPKCVRYIPIRTFLAPERAGFAGDVLDEAETCEILLDYWESEQPKRRVTSAVIKAVVAARFDVQVLDLVSSRRAAKPTWARQVAIYLCRTMTALSLPQIAKKFGDRDHSTILHAINKVSAVMKTDVGFSCCIESLKAAIEAS